MPWGIKYAGYSAPANTPFYLVVPFGLVIIAPIITAIRFKAEADKIDAEELKKQQEAQNSELN